MAGMGAGHEAEVAAVLASLRAEVEGRGPVGAGQYAAPRIPLGARSEAERYWGVTAERAYLYKPGLWGRIRGLALLPIKFPMRRLMRWYVEPLAYDQRSFNRAILRTVDELSERLDQHVAEVEERIARLEQRLPRG